MYAVYKRFLYYSLLPKEIEWTSKLLHFKWYLLLCNDIYFVRWWIYIVFSFKLKYGPGFGKDVLTRSSTNADQIKRRRLAWMMWILFRFHFYKHTYSTCGSRMNTKFEKKVFWYGLDSRHYNYMVPHAWENSFFFQFGNVCGNFVHTRENPNL